MTGMKRWGFEGEGLGGQKGARLPLGNVDIPRERGGQSEKQKPRWKAHDLGHGTVADKIRTLNADKALAAERKDAFGAEVAVLRTFEPSSLSAPEEAPCAGASAPGERREVAKRLSRVASG